MVFVYCELRMSGTAGDDGSEEYNMSKRQFMGGIAALGGYSLIDLADNGRIDGSPFGFISSFLSGGSSQPSEDVNVQYVENSTGRPREENVPTEESYDGRQETDLTDSTETGDDPNEQQEPDVEPTPEPEPDPEPDESVEDDPGNEEMPPDGTSEDGYVEDLGPGCDRLYLQGEGDSGDGNGPGTVIGLDLADQEYRVFPVSEFPYNEELTGLYDDLVDVREMEDLPADIGQGVRTNRDEVFEYSMDAYDDMSDEDEWSTIFDDNEQSNCTF